eukprot:COSAG01_NODE_661_length_14426_cov_32.272632_8_plen_182_part_00
MFTPPITTTRSLAAALVAAAARSSAAAHRLAAAPSCSHCPCVICGPCCSVAFDAREAIIATESMILVQSCKAKYTGLQVKLSGIYGQLSAAEDRLASTISLIQTTDQLMATGDIYRNCKSIGRRQSCRAAEGHGSRVKATYEAGLRQIAALNESVKRKAKVTAARAAKIKSARGPRGASFV